MIQCIIPYDLLPGSFIVRFHRSYIAALCALLVYSASFLLVHKLEHLPEAEAHSLEDHAHLHISELNRESVDEDTHYRYCSICSVQAFTALTQASDPLPVRAYRAEENYSLADPEFIFVYASRTYARAPPAILIPPSTTHLLT